MPWIYGLNENNGIRYYDTLFDLSNDASITNSKLAITRGSESVNDGKGAIYIIRKKASVDDAVSDNLSIIHVSDFEYVAEMMINSVVKDGDDYYIYTGNKCFRKLTLEENTNYKYIATGTGIRMVLSE